MTKYIEVKTIEHKGIKVGVKIDYHAGTATIVDILHANGETQSTPKKWVFSNRSLDYMNGWLDILEAMTVAVKECKKDLEGDLAQKTKFKEDIIIKSANRSKKS